MAVRETFTVTKNTLGPHLKSFPEDFDSMIEKTVDFYRPRVESYAKSNAPWTDRTGNARHGLMAVAEHEDDKHSIVLFHSVPYGIWLETRFEGRFAIILPTIQHEGKALMGTLRGAMKRVKYRG